MTRRIRRPDEKTLPSKAGLTSQDIEDVVAKMNEEFIATRVLLPPIGGPDYFPIIVSMTYSVL